MKDESNFDLWVQARQWLIDHPTEGNEEEEAFFLKVYDRIIAMYNRGEYTKERETRYVDVCVKMAQNFKRLIFTRMEAERQRSKK
jgi:hypothetical protein